MPSMKVKLRVPLSSAAREAVSPLSNARPAEDMDLDDDVADEEDDDDDDAGAAQQGLASGSDSDGAEEEDMEDEEEEEGDELDELDELVDESPAPPPAASNQASPKRSRITVKPRAPRSQLEGASASPTPSSNTKDMGSQSPGRNEGSAASSQAGGDRLKVLTGKKAAIARQQEAARLTVEELDALPAAKRRKSHKARGAPGPGRGWRKGLTKGQKPVYEIPGSESLPAAGSTPSSFGNTTATATATSPSTAALAVAAPAATKPAAPSSVAAPANIPAQRASPMVAKVGNADGSVASIKRPAPGPPPANAALTVKVQDAAGGRTLVSDLSAKAGTAKNPGFRYPPLPSSRGGPPVLPIAKIPIAFQGSIPIDRSAVKKAPRGWTKSTREVLSLGGRPWRVLAWYGGEDRGYEKKIDAALASALGPAALGAAGGAAAAAAGGGTGPGGKASPAPPATGATTYAGGTEAASTATATATVSTPVRATPTTPSGSHRPTSVAARLSPEKTSERAETPGGGSARPPASAGTASPLPPPRHIGAVREDVSWRGQSPAFLAGRRA